MSRKLTDRELADLFRYNELTKSGLNQVDDLGLLVQITNELHSNERTEVVETEDGRCYIIVFSGQDDVMDGYEVAV